MAAELILGHSTCLKFYKIKQRRADGRSRTTWRKMPDPVLELEGKDAPRENERFKEDAKAKLMMTMSMQCDDDDDDDDYMPKAYEPHLKPKLSPHERALSRP